MRGMKFSLKTLLLCIAVLAAVTSACISTYKYHPPGVILGLDYKYGDFYEQPSNAEIAQRIAWAWPLSIAGLFAIFGGARLGRMASMKLRLTIRELLCIVALVAVCVGWWIDHSAMTRQRDTAKGEADILERDNVRVRNLFLLTREKLLQHTREAGEPIPGFSPK
jgi:hypothetical protein